MMSLQRRFYATWNVILTLQTSVRNQNTVVFILDLWLTMTYILLYISQNVYKELG